MVENLFCPHAEGTPNCPIYTNWKEHYGISNEAVITEKSRKHEGPYKCVALEILSDGFVVPEENSLRKRIKTEDNKDTCRNLKCSYLESLNHQKKILKLLHDLVN